MQAKNTREELCRLTPNPYFLVVLMSDFRNWQCVNSSKEKIRWSWRLSSCWESRQPSVPRTTSDRKRQFPVKQILAYIEKWQEFGCAFKPNQFWLCSTWSDSCSRTVPIISAFFLFQTNTPCYSIHTACTHITTLWSFRWFTAALLTSLPK